MEYNWIFTSYCLWIHYLYVYQLNLEFNILVYFYNNKLIQTSTQFTVFEWAFLFKSNNFLYTYLSKKVHILAY